MNVLVTGASGRIGRYVVQKLAKAGHDVVAVDIVPPSQKDAWRFLLVDLTDAGQVYQALSWAKAEAVVHLGAWANAGRVPNTRTYGENVQSTFNVFQASADLGVQRVIFASSAQVYGLSAYPPLYLPLDEEHPLRPTNCYALSKMAGEQAAEYFGQFGLTILSFRFMGVRAPEELAAEVERISRNPQGDARLLWTRTDARDAALACRLALEAPQVPAGPYNITGGLVLQEDATALARRCFGEQLELREELTGSLSPLSCAKAQQAFGYRPRFLWREGHSFPLE